MFVFSRRAIQRCIDELRDVLSTEQLERLVKRLNRVGRNRFAASWEVCLLYSLSRIGVVSHEESLPNGRRPDVFFRYPGESTNGFVADITVISDEGLHNANPVQDLFEELARLARSAGLDPNHLRCEIRGQHDGPYGFQKTKLLLPPQAEIPAFLNSRISPFFEGIRNNENTRDQIEIKDDEISFTVFYDGSQQFMSGGYPAYDTARSRKKNPLWNKLVNKANRLAAVPASIRHVGIIACDAGCSLFQRIA